MNKVCLDKTKGIIKKFEGCELEAYLDENNIPTVGYGCTIHLDGKKVKLGDAITQYDAGRLLSKNINDIEEQLYRCIDIKLNDNQLSSLISLVYNIGIGNFRHSTMLKLINNSKFLDAANEFSRWKWSGGKVIKGLIRRRVFEKEIFLS